ncbi:MAG TPA: hypothetical protein DD400_06215 [Rhodospirillaceae bacterium]|nr:hypothetical protein [Rhodospirillaceae bacterium]
MRLLFLFLSVFCFVAPPCHAARAPLLSRAVGDGFGVQIKGWIAAKEDLERIHAAGFGFVRFAIGWTEIEKELGHYDWQQTDALVARVRRAGLKMVVPLLGGHPSYGGFVPAPPNNVDHDLVRVRAPMTPEAIQAYARFTAQVVLRYGSKDIVWEIWNEPDLARFWPPKADVQHFSVLAEAACKTMRSVVPDAFIVGPSLGRIPDPQDDVGSAFFESFLSSGASACMDAITVHPYRHGDEEPEAVFKDYRRLFPLMIKHRVSKPLLNTEWGYTGTQVSEEKRADYALRTRLIDVMWGVPLSIWYEWKDSRPDPEDDEGHFGLVYADGKAKPAFKWIERLLPVLRHAVLERQIHTLNPRDVLLLFSAPEGKQILVGWSLREKDYPSVSFKKEGGKEGVFLSSCPSVLGVSSSLWEISLDRP